MCFRSGRATPSTREMIAGMLSLRRVFMNDHSSSKEEVTSPKTRKGKTLHFADDYRENFDIVHQDDDYSEYKNEELFYCYLISDNL